MRRSLLLHSTSQSSARIDVEVARAAGRLSLRYVVSGRIADLRLPPRAMSARTDELWKNTCFEAFVRAGGPYGEFNFAPSTQWAAYRFDSYRSGMQPLDIPSPDIAVRTTGDQLALDVSLELGGLADLPAAALWHLNLSAVLEDTSGMRSYWALAHPPGAPDFHHRDCFALELPPA